MVSSALVMTRRRRKTVFLAKKTLILCFAGVALLLALAVFIKRIY